MSQVQRITTPRSGDEIPAAKLARLVRERTTPLATGEELGDDLGPNDLWETEEEFEAFLAHLMKTRAEGR